MEKDILLISNIIDEKLDSINSITDTNSLKISYKNNINQINDLFLKFTNQKEVLNNSLTEQTDSYKNQLVSLDNEEETKINANINKKNKEISNLEKNTENENSYYYDKIFEINDSKDKCNAENTSDRLYNRKKYMIYFNEINALKKNNLKQNEEDRREIINKIEDNIKAIITVNTEEINKLINKKKTIDENYNLENEKINNKIVDLTKEYNKNIDSILTQTSDNSGETNDNINRISDKWDKDISDYVNTINIELNKLENDKNKNNVLTKKLEEDIIQKFQNEIQELDTKIQELRRKLKNTKAKYRTNIEETKKHIGNEHNVKIRNLNKELMKLKKDNVNGSCNDLIKNLNKQINNNEIEFKTRLDHEVNHLKNELYNKAIDYISEIEKAKSEKLIVENKKNISINKINQEKKLENDILDKKIINLNGTLESTKQIKYYKEDLEINKIKYKNELQEASLNERKNMLNYNFKSNEELSRYSLLNLSTNYQLNIELLENNIQYLKDKCEKIVRHHKVLEMLQNEIFDDKKLAITKYANNEIDSLRMNNIFYREETKNNLKISLLKIKNSHQLINQKISLNNHIKDLKLDNIEETYDVVLNSIFSLKKFKENQEKIKYIENYVDVENNVIIEGYNFYVDSLKYFEKNLDLLNIFLNNLNLEEYINNKAIILNIIIDQINIFSTLINKLYDTEIETIQSHINFEVETKYGNIISANLETKIANENMYNSKLKSLCETLRNYIKTNLEFKKNINLIQENIFELKKHFNQDKKNTANASENTSYKNQISELNSEINRYKKLIEKNKNNEINIQKSINKTKRLLNKNNIAYLKIAEKIKKRQDNDLHSIHSLLDSIVHNKSLVNKKILNFKSIIFQRNYPSLKKLSEDLFNFVNRIKTDVNYNYLFNQVLFKKINNETNIKLLKYYQTSYHLDLNKLRKKSKQSRKYLKNEILNTQNSFKEKEKILLENQKKELTLENKIVEQNIRNNSNKYKDKIDNKNQITIEKNLLLKCSNDNIDDLEVNFQKESEKLDNLYQNNNKKTSLKFHKINQNNLKEHQKYIRQNKNFISLLVDSNKSIMADLKAEYRKKNKKYSHKIKNIQQNESKNSRELQYSISVLKTRFINSQLEDKTSNELLIKSIEDKQNKSIKQEIIKFKKEQKNLESKSGSSKKFIKK